MSSDRNPIIQDDPADTLYYVQCVMVALQEYYCAVDLPDRSQCPMVYTGLYWILKCSDEALGYERERVKK